MNDWNVIVSLRDRGYQKAFKRLQGFGAVNSTEFFNVLIMKVPNIERFCQDLQEWALENPHFLTSIARIVPVTATFSFQSREEFASQAQEIVLQWLPQLAGKKFHVRMNRRGLKDLLSSLDEEHFLNKILLDALEKAGTPGQITFENPDAIVVVETLGQSAGLACWQQEDLQRYPWLKID